MLTCRVFFFFMVWPLTVAASSSSCPTWGLGGSDIDWQVLPPTSARACLGLRRNTTLTLLGVLYVCVHACTTVYLCLSICGVYASVSAGEGKWKVCVEPSCQSCRVLQPSTLHWLELSTLMWWHGVKPQQGGAGVGVGVREKFAWLENGASEAEKWPWTKSLAAFPAATATNRCLPPRSCTRGDPRERWMSPRRRRRSYETQQRR